MVTESAQLLLIKKDRKYIFWYQAGEEEKIVNALLYLARDPEREIDWNDAVVMASCVGVNLEERIDYSI